LSPSMNLSCSSLVHMFGLFFSLVAFMATTCARVEVAISNLKT
jgi:hypothetical protein